MQAVCLGLVSETHYDPETGQFPTYIIIYKREELVENKNASEAGTLTEEMPFDLPDCFKNANPYSDCKFLFGRKTGKVLSKKETKIYKELGATLDRSAKANVPVSLSDWGEISEFRICVCGRVLRGYCRRREFGTLLKHRVLGLLLSL